MLSQIRGHLSRVMHSAESCAALKCAHYGSFVTEVVRYVHRAVKNLKIVIKNWTLSSLTGITQ